MQITDSLGLTDFAGFSGGAVYSIESRLDADPITRFCGVAVQGTAGSGLAHFLEASHVWRLANGVAEHVERFGFCLAQRAPTLRRG